MVRIHPCPSFLEKRLDFSPNLFFIDFGRWMRTTQGEALSVVRARSERSAECFCKELKTLSQNTKTRSTRTTQDNPPLPTIKRLRKGSFFLGRILTHCALHNGFFPPLLQLSFEDLSLNLTKNVTFSHLFLLRNGVLTPAQIKKEGSLSTFFFCFK